ncbi:MAG: N-acetyltransferase family protein [Saprospiraceae bacterium]
MTHIHIRPLLSSDWPTVNAIYMQGIATGIATFETQAPASWDIWDEKYLATCRFVAVIHNMVVGWIALTPFSKREVYRGVAEISLYVADQHRGQGIGKLLLQHLIQASELAGFWTLQSAIFATNSASIQLHLQLGFRLVGVREKIAMRDGIWHDNVLLERRSSF